MFYAVFAEIATVVLVLGMFIFSFRSIGLFKSILVLMIQLVLIVLTLFYVNELVENIVALEKFIHYDFSSVTIFIGFIAIPVIVFWVIVFFGVFWSMKDKEYAKKIVTFFIKQLFIIVVIWFIIMGIFGLF